MSALRGHSVRISSGPRFGNSSSSSLRRNNHILKPQSREVMVSRNRSRAIICCFLSPIFKNQNHGGTCFLCFLADSLQCIRTRLYKTPKVRSKVCRPPSAPALKKSRPLGMPPLASLAHSIPWGCLPKSMHCKLHVRRRPSWHYETYLHVPHAVSLNEE